MICGFSFSISTYSVAYGFVVAKTSDKKEAPSYEYHAYGGGLEPRQLNVPKKTNLVNLFRGCLALTHSPPIMPEAGGPLHEVAFIQALHGLGTIQGWLRGTGEQGNIASLHQSQSTAVFRHFVNVPATSDGWRTGLEVLEPCVGSSKIHRGNSPMITINFPTQAMLPNLSPWRVTTPGRVSYGQNINCQRQVHPRNMVAGAARLGQDPPPQWVSLLNQPHVLWMIGVSQLTIPETPLPAGAVIQSSALLFMTHPRCRSLYRTAMPGIISLWWNQCGLGHARSCSRAAESANLGNLNHGQSASLES